MKGDTKDTSEKARLERARIRSAAPCGRLSVAYGQAKAGKKIRSRNSSGRGRMK